MRATSPSQLNDPRYTRLDAPTLARFRATASQFQRNLVADGSLTLNDYERAELATVSCLEFKGYHVDPSSTKLNGLARMKITVSDISNITQEQNDRGACAQQYSAEVDLAWAGVTVGITEKVVAASRKFMLSCLTDAHVTVAQRPWASTDPSLSRIYQRCETAAVQKFDTGGLAFGVEGDNNYRGAGP